MTTLQSNRVRLPGTRSLFLRPFSVDEYHRMIETGVFDRDNRFELLDGWIVAQMPHNPPHDLTVSLALKQVGQLLTDDWICRVQSAVTLATSEPEPDLAVVRGPERRYARSHPKPGDIGCLIEVAESSLDDDREQKGALYAHAGIPHYWIVNLIDQVVEAFADPSGPQPAYRTKMVHGPNDLVALTLDGQTLGTIRVADLLP